jgi:hypothetical protein
MIPNFENPSYEIPKNENSRRSKSQVEKTDQSERLRRWAEAFEAWLAERKERYGASTVKQAKLAWRRLLQERRKMPWELDEADIEGHAGWMAAMGYSPATISNAVGIMANFYRWCGERQIDPECAAGFNPAENARRPKVGRYREAKLLSREEVGRLLRTMQLDSSALGKRDYAFTLARLRLGVALRQLQRLTWGQIEAEAEGAWVRWRAEAERQRLPGEVWEAIQAALEAGGRLGSMQEEDYVFAPLGDAWKGETGDRAEDWARGRPLSTSELLGNLKLYGRLAGVAEEKLTLQGLRRTAMRLKMDEGADVTEMKAFLDSQEEKRFTKYRLGKLPELPVEAGRGPAAVEDEPRVPVRKAKPFQPGEGVKHGFYAQSQPPEAVRVVLREDIRGLEEEIVGLRMLGRGMLERQGRAARKQEAAQLGEAYSLTAFRLGEVIRAEGELTAERESDRWAEEVMERLSQVMVELGIEPTAEAAQEKSELEAGARRVVEEIAAMRYCLRNTFRLALETEETREYIRYAEIYSSGCMRLAKLLRMERGEANRQKANLNKMVDEAIQEITATWEVAKAGS